MAIIEWHRILQTDSIQRMSELIRREFNLWAGFVDADGQHMWIGVAQQTDKPLCESFLIRNASKTCIDNYKDWINDISPASPASLFMQCHAGMQGIIVPIVHKGECVGAFIASGFVFADAENADERIISRGVHLDIHSSTLAHGCRELVRLTYRESQILRGILEEMANLSSQFIDQCRSESHIDKNSLFWVATYAPFSSFIGSSEMMQNIVTIAKRLSSSQAPVLITGERGTGKTKLARTIREASSRRSTPYVIIDSEGIASDEIESELFGHKRGASANAFIDKLGLLDVADKGTLLIQNIDALPISVQTKLALFLESNTFLPAGNVAMHRVDVRIMATSTRVLHHEVETGTFHRNLYEKLCIVPLHMPELVAHAEDIPDLCRYFLEIKCNANKRPCKTLSENALRVLCQYSWSGNVRELENEIERIVVVSGNNPVIEVRDIALRIRQATNSDVDESFSENSGHSETFETYLHTAGIKSPDGAITRYDTNPSDPRNKTESATFAQNFKQIASHSQSGSPTEADTDKLISPYVLLEQYATLSDMLSAVEREIIQTALEQNDYNRTRTAKYLHISRRHLVRKLDAYGIQNDKT